jgi:hypothetical protein
MKGIDIRRNNNGFVVVTVHYSASPDKDAQWLEESRKGYPTNMWEREMELNWSTGEGDPVHPSFDKTIHTGWFDISKKFEVFRGWDFGRKRPACIWLQNNLDIGQIIVKREFKGDNLHFSQFIKEVLDISRKEFNGCRFIDCCDPYGGVQKGDKSLFSNVEMMSAYGLFPMYQRTNIEKRVQKIEKLLDPKFNKGKPGIVFDKKCVLLVSGMDGGLVLDSKEKPKKDKKYEDVYEAMCYAIDNMKNLSFWDERIEPDDADDDGYTIMGRPKYKER